VAAQQTRAGESNEQALRGVESIDELRTLVGQELSVGAWVEITQERVNAFADITGDHYFIHVDPERARETPLGGTVAHGYLTLSSLPLLGQHRTGIAIDLHPRLMLNYGLNRVRFTSPVRVGKRIRLRTALQSVDEVEPNVYLLTQRQTVEIENEAKPAMIAEALLRVYL
jgi:acyl dehydratase